MEPMHRSTPGGRSSHHARSAPKGFAGTPGDFWMCPPGVCISWAGSRMHRWIRARHDAAAEDVRRDLHIATAEASAMQRISGTAGRGDAYSRRSETLVHVCRTQIEKQPRGHPLGCECLVGVRRFELLTSSVSERPYRAFASCLFMPRRAKRAGKRADYESAQYHSVKNFGACVHSRVHSRAPGYCGSVIQHSWK